MIFRSFITRESKYLLPLYKALMLSKIDYCSPLYSPMTLEGMRKLEKIQATFTRRLTGMTDSEGNKLDYWDRLKRLNLLSVQRRHERYAVIYIWKAYGGITRNPGLEFEDTGRRGLMVKIPDLKGTRKFKQKGFLIRGAKIFNSLPKKIRDQCCLNIDKDEWYSKQYLNTFKTDLDNFLRCLPDHPNVSVNYAGRINCYDGMGKRSNSIIDHSKLIDF